MKLEIFTGPGITGVSQFKNTFIYDLITEGIKIDTSIWINDLIITGR